jgi:hypothetical protein
MRNMNALSERRSPLIYEFRRDRLWRDVERSREARLVAIQNSASGSEAW